MYVCLYCPSVLVTQSCSILWDPMDCSPPGSSIHEIIQERILRWITIPFSRGSPDLGIETRSPALQADSIVWATSIALNDMKSYQNILSKVVWWQQISQVALVGAGGNSPTNAGDKNHSSILAWRNPKNRGAWESTVHGVAQSWTCLST